MEMIFRLFIVPLALSVLTAAVLTAFEVVAVTGGVFLTVYIIWLIVVNGGFLLLDGDLNLFD